MEPITVKYKVLDPRARTPAYATPGSAAADLESPPAQTGRSMPRIKP